MINFDWQIPMRLNPFSKEGVHHGLRGWTDSDWLGQLGLAGLGNPSNFRSKVGDVSLLSLQGLIGDKDRKIGIADSQLLDLLVKEGLDKLPDRISPGTENVTARDVVVLNEFSFQNNLEYTSSTNKNYKCNLNSHKIIF